MKININDCLKLDAFRGSRVLSCKSECSRRVRSVSVLDEHAVCDASVVSYGDER